VAGITVMGRQLGDNSDGKADGDDITVMGRRRGDNSDGKADGDA
jgi:hypothetical protein